MNTPLTTNLTNNTKARHPSACLLSALCDLRGLQIHERRSDFDRARSGVESNPFLCPVPCPLSPLIFMKTFLTTKLPTHTKARHVSRCLLSDLRDPRGFQMVVALSPVPCSQFPLLPRHKPVTSNCIFASAHLSPIASSFSPIYVRVFSEYSDIPNCKKLKFPARNTQLEVRERKSSLTSFLNLRAPVGQAFLPDECVRQRGRRCELISTIVSLENLTYGCATCDLLPVMGTRLRQDPHSVGGPTKPKVRFIDATEQDG